MRLKELRIKNNYTQREIAQILKMTPSGYGFYEAERSEPNIEALITLADIYHVSIDELVGRNFNLKLTEQEQELLDKVKQLTPIEFGKVIGYIDNMLKYKQEQKRQIFFENLNNKEDKGE